MVLMSLVLAVGLCPGPALAGEAEGEEAGEATTPEVQMLVASGGADEADEGAEMGAESEMDAQAATTWHRLFGDEALDTMEKIVNAGWKGTTGSTVVLTTDSGYWDALTAAGAAGFTNAPVLMTAPKSLSPQTSRLLKQLKPKRIIICGGTAVVSKAVEKAAASAAGGATVKRFWGQTMTDTADEIFKGAASYCGGTWSRTAFVATSNGYWDALSAAPISYRKHMPIFLTQTKDKLSAKTIAAMRGKIDKVVIVGGTAVVSEAVERQLKAAGIKVDRRLGGKTAIDTSVLVANYGVSLGMKANNVGVATQNGYWDALSGAALCGKKNSVLVLVDGASSASISGFVGKRAKSISNGYIFGGIYAVGKPVADRLIAATTDYSLYLNVISNAANGWGDFSGWPKRDVLAPGQYSVHYALFDIDGNGVKELLVKDTGYTIATDTSDPDPGCNVYTISNGKVVLCGKMAIWHAQFMYTKDGKLFKHIYPMGNDTYIRIVRLSGTKLTQSKTIYCDGNCGSQNEHYMNLFKKAVGTTECENIEWTPITDNSAVKALI